VGGSHPRANSRSNCAAFGNLHGELEHVALVVRGNAFRSCDVARLRVVELYVEGRAPVTCKR
jgi:hypothetical protein